MPQSPFSDPVLSALAERFDPLLADPSRRPAADDLAELSGLARVFDLDDGDTPAALWRAVRAVLERQSDFRAETPAARHGLRVLVVEDDPLIAQDLCAVLNEAGHEVIGPFAAAEAAWAAIVAGGEIDVALLDINLAGSETGVDLAGRIAGRGGPPVVFLSGDVTAAARHAGLSSAMVFKPWRGDEVLAAINRLTALADAA